MGLKKWFLGYRYLGQVNLRTTDLREAERAKSFSEVSALTGRFERDEKYHKQLAERVKAWGGLGNCDCEYQTITDDWGDASFIRVTIYGHVANKRS